MMTKKLDCPTVDLRATGLQIDKLRRTNGLSVIDVSEIAGVSIQAVYHWQNGKCLPTVDNLVVLAAAFKVKIDEIVVTK